MDEPDAKLDPSSANRVMENIFGLKGVTVIIITHHISRAMRCDKVIVMKKGRVVEKGNPNELSSRDGHFSRMLASDMKRRVNSVSPESDTEVTE